MNPYDISPADQDPRSDFWGSYPEGFKCPWCGITEVKDQDDKCMECRVCEAEELGVPLSSIGWGSSLQSSSEDLGRISALIPHAINPSKR